MKIALVHDYLKEFGGAERVLKVLAKMYPEAPIYTAFVVRGSRAGRMFSEREVRESGWGWFLKIGRLYSYLRFALPWIWKSVDLSEYELVLTSCSGYIARGFRVGAKTKVVAYCHTPPKWLYGYETPTGAGGKWWGRAYLWLFGPFVRYFDYQSAQRVNKWMANSEEVKKRIAKFYRQEAVVVYPPINVTRDMKHRTRGDYYLVVARQVGAKGIELAIEACRQIGRELVVVGERAGGGTRRSDKGVRYTGWVDDEELAKLYAGARGYLALAKDEDFGMTVVEAMAAGTPVVAFDSGGYKETVITGETGMLVKKYTLEGVVEGMKKLEQSKWKKEAMRGWAKRFGRVRFEKEVREVVGA